MQPPTVREVIRRLEDEGWVLSRIKGDHRIFTKAGKVIVVSGNLNDTLKRGTWGAIRRQAEW